MSCLLAFMMHPVVLPLAASLRHRFTSRLLDGFEGKLTSSKWAAIAKCSPDTALRDINDLLARGVLRKSDAGGRSTSYELNDLPEPMTWHPGGMSGLESKML